MNIIFVVIIIIIIIIIILVMMMMMMNLHNEDKGEVKEGGKANKLEAVFVETPFQNKDLEENIFFHGQIMYNNTGQKRQ